MDIEDYIKRIEKDLTEVKADVKNLLMFMAVEKANAKRSTYIISIMISSVISLVGLLIKAIK